MRTEHETANEPTLPQGAHKIHRRSKWCVMKHWVSKKMQAGETFLTLLMRIAQEVGSDLETIGREAGSGSPLDEEVRERLRQAVTRARQPTITTLYAEFQGHMLN